MPDAVHVCGSRPRCLLPPRCKSHAAWPSSTGMLPGLAPTGKPVSVPFIVVVEFEGDKVCKERAPSGAWHAQRHQVCCKQRPARNYVRAGELPTETLRPRPAARS